MSWEFFNKRSVTGRKDYRCSECGVDLPKGTQHVYCSGKCEGDITDYRLCEECDLISTAYCIAFDDGAGWPMGELRSSLVEYEGITEDLKAWATRVLAENSEKNRRRHEEARRKALIEAAAPGTLALLTTLRGQVRPTFSGHTMVINDDVLAAWDAALAVANGEQAASPPEEHTSARVAHIAAIGLHAPESLTPEQIRTVCASALTQRPDREHG